MEIRTALLLLCTFIGVAGSTCYPETTTTTPYDIIERSTVETRRSCEVLCDGNPLCIGISFFDPASDCALLETSKVANTICAAETTIFLKQTAGCLPRTNITAEFGVDPCIDERVDSAFRGVGQAPICEQNKSLQYIIRAVDSNGNRITLDNDNIASIQPWGDMWMYTWYWQDCTFTRYIIAATCATAGAAKCPCSPLPHYDSLRYPNYPAQPDVDGPCNRSTPAMLWFDQFKRNACSNGPSYLSQEDTAKSFVKCKAGLWLLWSAMGNNVWGVNGVSCHYG